LLKNIGAFQTDYRNANDFKSTSAAHTPGQPSERSKIESFKVMDVLAQAEFLEKQGKHIIHMEVGQPSTGAPSLVIETAIKSLREKKLGYTNALGISSLREAISKHYSDKYGCKVDSNRVVVTTGSSAAFIFTFLGCFDIGASVGLCSSGYPCYRNDLKAAGLEYVSIPVNKDYKVTSFELEQEIQRREVTKLPPLQGLILSSPSNPTGAMLTPQELFSLCETCKKHGITFISDEIYHGISYGKEEASAVQFSDSSIVINSFSKYYSMTGWRLGWMVVPHSMVDTMNRLSQNLCINAPTLSQIAACKAFSCSNELNKHVSMYAINRQCVLDTLSELGLLAGASPADGAFYVYCDLAHAGIFDTPTLCHQLLVEAGLALTPGVDFEDPESGLGNQRVRFSYSRSVEEVSEGMQRFKRWWIKKQKSVIAVKYSSVK